MAAATSPARAGLSGKDAYVAWLRYCQDTGTTTNTESLTQWDAEHNNFGIRNRYSEDEIYRVGLSLIYERFYKNYSRFTAKMGKVTRRLTGIRSSGLGKGNNVHLKHATADDIEFMTGKVKGMYETAHFKVKYFNTLNKLTTRQIRTIMEETFAEVFGDEE